MLSSYHASCYKAHMRPIPKDNSEAETCHGAAFALLAVYMDPLLSSGRALTIRALLDKYKHFLAAINIMNILIPTLLIN